MRIGLAVLVVMLGGCELYFGGDDQPPPPCAYDGGGAQEVPDQGYRNPDTGECQYFGYPYPCDDTCGPCPAVGLALPDWGMCYSTCDGLTEAACVTTPGCYASYLDGYDARNFWGCWQVAQTGPIHGACANLDAHSCSQHDDCSAVYGGAAGATKFEQCIEEQTTSCTSDADCGSNGRCADITCHPDPNCPNCPTCGACAEVCTGVCVPKDPNSCDSVTCGSGYHCEEHCYGDPSTNTMNACEAFCVQDLTCASVDCGPGYECSEVCSPDSNGNSTCHPSCVPSNTCETLQTEQACVSRADCVPVYDGQDCTCYPDHCGCQILTYERCETR